MAATTFTNVPAPVMTSNTNNKSNNDDLFASISTAFTDDFAGEEDLDLEDFDESKDSLGDLSKSPARKLKRPASTAEKKATHNAVERARRESLNGRFLVLADMLPGMTHVKRASKAAIVNKSIELINELQATESRLTKENEALRQELNTMRQRVTLPNMFGAAAAAAAAAGMAGMPMTMPMPMPTPQPVQTPLSMPAMQPQTQQQHLFGGATLLDSVNAQGRPSSAHSNSANATPAAHMPLFPGVFNGLFNAGNAIDSLDAVRSESGSPTSVHSNSHLAASHMSGVNGPNSSNNASFLQNNGYFDFSGLKQENGASPDVSSFPSCNTAPSPASSHSIPTPINAYSPISLPALSTTGSSSAASSSSASDVKGGAAAALGSPGNPVIAAFDSNADASFLAAQFAPRDIAKAQMELQQFIAYQQRLAAAQQAVSAAPAQNSNNGGMAAALAFGSYPFNGQQMTPGTPQQQQQFCASQGMNIPAWQMMMAQQQALTAYGGGHPF